MARFMVKASEFKNVCKAVNDRKLAELKKEIIEILKKQDEKEVKKAIDYFNSQELHYTHLEKSLNGKWIEKAGYGVGTVRIWKGKKYKKIAPGKWARVFEKEGRGTNVAIGRLIAQIGKIDNVEDLMAFVQSNKQRFVDENGVDLPVLDKLRAAVDTRNGNVESKGKTEKKFDSKEVLANLDKYVKTIGGVYGIKKYTETDDTNETFERIKYHFESDSNSSYDDAQGWNQAVRQIAEYAKKEGLSTDELIKQSIKNNIKDESIEGTPTFGGKKTEYMERLEEQSKKAEEGRNKQTETKVNGYGEATDREITSLAYKRDVARKERDFNNYFGRGMDKKNNNKGTSKPSEKKKTFKQEMNELYDAQDEAWEGFESGSDIKSSPENSKKFYDRVKKFVDDNNIKLSQKHYDEIEDSNGHSFNEALELAGAYGEEKKEKALAKNREYSKKYKGQILDLSMIDEFKTENKPAEKKPVDFLSWMEKNDIVPEDYAAMRKDKIISDIKERTGLGDENAVKIADDLIAYNKESGDYHYWIMDSRGNRLTNEDAIKRIQDNLARIDELERGNEPRKDMKIRELKSDNEYLKERLNPDDRKESEAEKHQNRSEAMKGNKNAVKVGGEKDVIGTFTKSADGSVEMPANKEVKELFDSLNSSRSKEDIREAMKDAYYNDGNIVASDTRRLVCIKVGDIGIENGFVKVDAENGKIKISPMPDKTKEYQFPNYKRVISKAEDNNQEVKLDNKALKDKLKEMKKEGAYTKDKPKVTFEFENGKVLLDGTVVGTGNVDFGDEEKFINFNAQYLTDAALSGDNASMFISDDPNNAVSISTNTSDTLIMPIITEKGKADYSENRAAKEKEKSEKAEKLSKNRERNESLIKESIKDIDGQVERVYSNVDNKISSFSDEELKRNYDILNLNMDKIMDRSVDFPSKVVDKKTNASFAMAYAYSKLKEKHPDVKDKFLAELEKRGISVKKSLFDDFLFIETVDEDIDDMEEDQEEESLFNDYSAEQPELFNSTEFQVREALNRRFNCL